jgi:hypothetical protein
MCRLLLDRFVERFARPMRTFGPLYACRRFFLCHVVAILLTNFGGNSQFARSPVIKQPGDRQTLGLLIRANAGSSS